MKTYIKIKLFFSIVMFCISTIAYSQYCISKISAGGNHFTFQKIDGSIFACGRGGWGALANNTAFDEPNPVALTTGINWLLVESGYLNTFGIKNDHTLWGTGNNTYGALGIGSTITHLVDWTQIGTATNWAKVAGGDYFSIALKTNGALWGWGQNSNYQMGNNVCCGNQLTPIQIGTDTDWKEIDASTFVSAGFAIKNNGTLWGWGSNSSGILCAGGSVPNRPIPAQLNPDTDWKSVSAGGEHILALKTNNTLWSWGAYQYGQLGRDYTGTVGVPTQIGTDTWKQVTAGMSLSFGIKTDGTLWAWGKNDLGQLGIGNSNTTNQYAPVQLGSATNWESVSCGGYDFAVALKTDGSLWTWGQNDFGQLANGTTTPQLVPTMVISCLLNTENFTKQNVNIYPNPAKDILNINLESSTISSINIYNNIGQLVLSNIKPSKTITISELKAGAYFMIVNFNEQSETVKFIKE
jgi:alpha-tubulin suppressor-like RCC1 family protein